MAPHGVVGCEGRTQEFSIRDQVVIDSLAAFEAEAEQPESPYKGLHPHATIMALNGQAEDAITRAISLATQGDVKKPFTIEVQPDGLGVTWVNGVRDDVYKEEIPNAGSVVVLGHEGR